MNILPNATLASVIDFTQFVNILNYVLIGAFIAVIVFFVVSVISGFIRGAIPGTFRLVFMTVLIILSIIILKPLVDIVSNINISFIIGDYGVITRGDTGQQAIFQVGTIKDTLTNALASFFYLYKISVVPSVIAENAIKLAGAFITFGVFFIEMLLLSTFGNALAFILYHVFFKRAISKRIRKVVKIRWLGAIEFGITYIVVVFLAASPLTSMVNTVNQAWQRRDVDTSASDTLKLIDDGLKTYDNSLFAQVFYNWTADESGVTLDTNVLNSFLSTTIDDVEVSFLDTLNDLSSISTVLLGALSSEGFDIGYILQQDVLISLFECLGNNSLVTLILPLVAEIAINSDLLLTSMRGDYIDLSDIEWQEEINQTGQIVIDLINTGIIDIFIDPSTKQFKDMNTIKIKDIISVLLTDESFGYVKSSLLRIKDSKLLSRIVPSLMYYLSNNMPDIGKYLPTTWGEISSIQWGDELSIVLESLYKINKSCPEFLNAIFETNKKEAISYLNIKQAKKPEEEMLDLILDNLDSLSNILLGDFSLDGELLNCDEYGKTKVYESGRKISGRSYCLFDSTLIKYIFPSISTLLLDLIKDNFGETLDTTQAEATLNELGSTSYYSKNLKLEFKAIFKTFSIIKDKPELVSKLADGIDINTLDSKDFNVLGRMVESFDNSKVFKSISTPLCKKILSEDSFTQALSNIGLTFEDLNLEPKDGLGHEFAKILYEFDSFKLLTDLSSSGSSTSEMITKLACNKESLIDVLDLIFNCQIINPIEIFEDETKENNYFKILSYVFGDGVSEGLIKADGLYFDKNIGKHPNSRLGGIHNWSNSRDANGNLMRDRFGNLIIDGENGYIANVLCEVAKNIDGETNKTIFDLLDSGNLDISKLEGSNSTTFKISSLLKSIDYSSFFSSTFGSFLDNALEDSGLVDHANHVSFKNVTNWENEGIAIGNTILEMQKLDISLNNLDFSKLNSSDIPVLNSILHNISDSGIFTTEDAYNFNLFVFSKMTQGFASGTDYNFFCDPDTLLNPTYFEAEKDFDIVNDANGRYSIAVKDDWNSPLWKNDRNDPNFYSIDEISKLCGAISALFERYELELQREYSSGTPIKYRTCFSYLTSGEFTSKDISVILNSFNEAKTCRMVIFHAFDTVFNTVSISGEISFANANTSYMLNSKEKRQTEIDKLVDIFECFEKCNVLKGVGSLDIDTLLSSPDISANIYRVLLDLNSSYVLHQAGPKDELKPTVFQSCIVYFLKFDSVKSIIFSTNSPKDLHFVSENKYENAETKALWLTNNIFPYAPGSDFDEQEEEVLHLCEAISSMCCGYQSLGNIELEYEDHNDGTYTLVSATNTQTGLDALTYSNLLDSEGNPTSDFSNVDISKCDSASLEEIMNNFNASSILSDCIPNALDTMIGKMNSSTAFDSVDFSKAYFFYFYDGENWDSSMDDEEVHYLTSLFDSFNKISSINVSSLTSLSSEDLAIFNEEFPEIIKNMSLSKSLHGYYANSWVNEFNTNSMTILEQVMFSIYQKSGLCDFAYDSIVDTIYASANDKLIHNIKALTKKDLGLNDDYVGLSNSWYCEAMSLSTLFKNVADLVGDSFSGFSFNSSSELMTPSNLEILMVNINHVDCISDALPKFVSDIMKQTNFHEFTKFNSIYYGDYYLSQSDYDGDNGVISSIVDLMETFETTDLEGHHTGYLSLDSDSSNPMLDLIDSGISCKDFIKFIYQNKMYAKSVLLDSNEFDNFDDTTNCSSLVLYNIFDKAGISQYILGNNPEQKLRTIGWLMNGQAKNIEGDLESVFHFNIDVEGDAFDDLFKLTSEFYGKNTSDFNIATSLSTVFYKIMVLPSYSLSNDSDDEYIAEPRGSRSFLTSEIVSGVVDGLVKEELSHSSYLFEEDFCKFKKGVTSHFELSSSSYDLLELREAKGIHGMFEVVDIFTSFDPINLHQRTSDFDNLGFVECFENMSLNGSNSEVAILIYESRLQGLLTPLKLVFPAMNIPDTSDLISNDASFAQMGQDLASILSIPE